MATTTRYRLRSVKSSVSGSMKHGQRRESVSEGYGGEGAPITPVKRSNGVRKSVNMSKRMSDIGLKGSAAIKVIVRKRPLGSKENGQNTVDVVDVVSPSSLNVCEPKYAFDFKC